MHTQHVHRSTRLRFFVTSCHSEEQIRFAVKVLAEELSLLHDAG